MWFHWLISNTLDEFANNNKLSKDIVDHLKPVNATTPRFYLLPKIRKEGNPGRPVVSSVNSHTSKISKFVDHHIQPLAKGLISYVKDTTDFITKIKDLGTLPPNSFPVSMGITSLYTNIPNDERLEALRQSLDSSQNQSTSTKAIVTLIHLILALNNFVFNGINFLQTQGASMGTNTTPSFSTIFMGYFEEIFIYPFIQNLHSLYLRYIDDIFMIWTGTKLQFEQFIMYLNQEHPSIKFTYKISYEAVEFLDTTVYIDKNNQLQTKLYRKLTDRQNYFH